MATSNSSANPKPPRPHRVGQMVYLRPECIEEYKTIHAAVWPEVLEQIKDSNISEYSIHLALQPRPTLFATFKYTPSDPNRDPEVQFGEDMARMARNPKLHEWWAVTDAMQETPLEGGSTGSLDPRGWWLQMEEVFWLQ